MPHCIGLDVGTVLDLTPDGELGLQIGPEVKAVITSGSWRPGIRRAARARSDMEGIGATMASKSADRGGAPTTVNMFQVCHRRVDAERDLVTTPAATSGTRPITSVALCPG